MRTVLFKTNINCGNCIRTVTPFLNELDNVEEWSVDTEDPDKILKVLLEDDDDEKVVQAVKKAGFRISAPIKEG